MAAVCAGENKSWLLKEDSSGRQEEQKEEQETEVARAGCKWWPKIAEFCKYCLLLTERRISLVS